MSSLIQNSSNTGSTTEYLKINKMTKGDNVIGIYQKSFTGGEFNQTTHYFLTDDGKQFAIDGVSMLNRKMVKVPVGSRVRISYHGKENFKGAKGNISSHQVNVNLLAADGTDTPILLQKGDTAPASDSGSDSFRQSSSGN